MARRCLVCSHPNKLEIERAYIAGKPISRIGREFGVGDDSVRNHCHNHLSRQLVQHYRKKEAIEAQNLLGDIEELINRSKRILSQAEDKKQHGLALKAIGEARAGYELLLKIAVALHETRQLELEEEAGEREIAKQEENNRILRRGASFLNPAEDAVLKALCCKMISERKDNEVFPMKCSREKLLEKVLSYYPEGKKPFSVYEPKSSVVSRRRRKPMVHATEEEISAETQGEHANLADDGEIKEKPLNELAVKPIPALIDLRRKD